MEPEDIIRQIEALDAYELQQFKALYAGLGEDRRQLPRQEQYVADAISDLVRIHMTASRWRKLGIEARSTELYDWLGDQTSGLNETQVKGLVRVCVKSIASRLHAREEIVDIASLLSGLKTVGLAMDRSFPGYWAGRLLPLLVQKEEPRAA